MNDQYLLAVFIAGTIMITIFAVMMTVFLVIHKQRQNRSKLERQQLEFAYNSALLKTKIEMQEQARQWQARYPKSVPARLVGAYAKLEEAERRGDCREAGEFRDT